MLKMILPILLFLGLNAYIALRFFRLTPGPFLFKLLPVVLVGLATFCFILSFSLRSSLAPQFEQPLYSIGTTWFFASIYFFMFLAAIDIVYALLHLRGSSDSLPRILRLALVILLPLNVLAYGYFHYRDKQRRELTYDFSQNAPQQTSMTLVVLSDLHLGYTIGAAELNEWIALINREKPDAVLLVGDIIDCDVRPLLHDSLAPLFCKIQSRYGTYAVPGNHEYIAGIDRSCRFLRQAGIHLLRDSAAILGNSLRIVGRDDRSNPRRMPLARLMQESPGQELPTIVLDHQPYHLEEAARSHADLQLSGHTHDGQIWPASWFVRRLYEQPHGPLQKEKTNYYVTSGIGLWGGKFRIGTDSEYLVVHLTLPAPDGAEAPDGAPADSTLCVNPPAPVHAQ